MRDENLAVLAALAAALAWWLIRSGGDAVSIVSSALSPRGIRNNNPGNLEYLPPSRAWNGQVGSDGRFGVYDTAANGVRAMARQLLKYERSGLSTVRGLINRWAPPVENDTGAYVSAVARALGVGPDQGITVSQVLPQLVAAIIKHENGQQPYSMANLRQWVYL